MKNATSRWLFLLLLVGFTNCVLADGVQDQIARLKDGDSGARASAAEALGKLGDARAVEPLIARLKEDQYRNLQKSAADALVALGKPAVEPLIACLKDQDRDMRASAAEALGKLGDVRAVEPLIACLKDPAEVVRESAAVALGDLHDERAVEPLITCLKDSYRKVQGDALKAYFKMQSLANVGQSASDALVKMGKPAVEPLIACLKDPSVQARASTAEALGKLGDAQAVEPLIACLKDPDVQARASAAEALGKLGYHPTNDVEKAIYTIAMVKWDEATKLGKPAVEPLIACLKDQDWIVQSSAATALGKLGDDRAVEPLIVCLKDQDRGVRHSAAEALGKLRDARAVEPLIACLKDESWNVQSSADALVALGKPAEEPLIACLKDPDGDVRKSAAEALGKLDYHPVTDIEKAVYLIALVKWDEATKLGEPAIEPLIAALKDHNLLAQAKATEALRKLGKPTVEPLIAHLKDQDYDMRGSAAVALRKNWENTKYVLLTDAQSRNQQRIETAVDTFISLGNEEIVPQLIDILNTQGNKEMAVTYLNCGHDGLENAARAWASAHGYQISSGGTGGKASWGRP